MRLKNVSKPTEKVQEELSKIKELKLKEEELVFRQLKLIFIVFYCLSCGLQLDHQNAYQNRKNKVAVGFNGNEVKLLLEHADLLAELQIGQNHRSLESQNLLVKMDIKHGQVYLCPVKWGKSYDAKASSKAWLNISFLLFLLVFHKSYSQWIYGKATKTAAGKGNVMGMFLSTWNSDKLLFYLLLVLYFPVNCFQCKMPAAKQMCSHKGGLTCQKKPVFLFLPKQNP